MERRVLEDYLKSLGAALVGFADLSEIEASLRNSMRYGIVFAVNLRPEIVKGIYKGPTDEYHKEYNHVNKILDDIATACVTYIKKQGYNAVGQISTIVASNSNLATPLPHKTIATRAGLGWIGKNALLVTPEYGSAIRLCSVLTDMPFETGKPINESRCGKCTRCTDECPAGAIEGLLWNVNSSREELMDAFKCRRKARELSKQAIDTEISLCGKCIEVCPYTNRYISAWGNNRGKAVE